MNIVHTDAYRAAFVEYLRRGTPLRLSRKDTGVTVRYVWRTQRDERVRTSHRMNDGRIFLWLDPPDTRIPGEVCNFGCEAISELGGIAYTITGEWEAHFQATVSQDRNRSQYWDPNLGSP